jgi:hypothetical protein
VQPGGIYVHMVHREPTSGGPGSGLRRGRKRFLCQLPLWFYICLSIYASKNVCHHSSYLGSLCNGYSKLNCACLVRTVGPHDPPCGIDRVTDVL